MRTAKLGEVCEFKPSKRLARASLAETDAVSFVPMNDLGIHQKYIGRSEQRQLSEVIGSYTYFAEGDVLLAKITPCFENGKLGIARELANGVGFGSSEFTVIRPSDQVLAEYLYYFLDRDEVRLQGAKVMTGAVGHKRVPSEFVEALEIPLPPLKEQRRIVAVLDEAFAAISIATANAEKNLANALALPGAHLAGLLGSEDDFELVPISQVAFIQEGPGIRKYEYQDDGYPMINVRCVQDGWIDLSKGRAANYELATGKWAHFQVDEGDILLTTSGTIGRCAIAGRHDLPLLMNTSVVRFRSESDRLRQKYLYHFLRSDLFQKPLANLASGTAIANVGPTHIKTLSIAIPPLDDQERIIDQLDAMIEVAAELRVVCERKLLALASLKQSLLERAFTGELTAVTLETIAA